MRLPQCSAPRSARLRALLCAAFLLGAAAGCNRTTVRSHIDNLCSTSKDDNPFYSCDPAQNLICINTTLSNAYYCRVPCAVGQPGCPPTYVCCAGKTYGASRGAAHGCTPRNECDIAAAGTSEASDDAGSYTPPDADDGAGDRLLM
jgi:hypothetical protein